MKLVMIVAATIFVAGCAGPNGNGYVSPSQRLVNASLEEVAGFSYDMKKFLASGKSEQDAIASAQKAVADSLKDPESARFRNVKVKPYLEGHIVCGEVNGKNSYGAYVGFRPFAASPTAAVIQSTGSRYASTDELANTGLRSACGA